MWQNNPYPTAGPSQDFQAQQPPPMLGPTGGLYGPFQGSQFVLHPPRPDVVPVMEGNQLQPIRGPWQPIPGPSGMMNPPQAPPTPRATWPYEQTIQDWTARRDLPSEPIFEMMRPRADEQKEELVRLMRGDMGTPSRESTVNMRQFLQITTQEMERERNQQPDTSTGYRGVPTPAGVESRPQPAAEGVATGAAQTGGPIEGFYREGEEDDSDDQNNSPSTPGSPTTPGPPTDEESPDIQQPREETESSDTSLPGPSYLTLTPQPKRMRVSPPSLPRQLTLRPQSAHEERVGGLPRSEFIQLVRQTPEELAKQVRMVRRKQRKMQQEKELSEATKSNVRLRKEKGDIERAAAIKEARLEQTIEILREERRQADEKFQKEKKSTQRREGCLIGHLDRARNQMAIYIRAIDRLRTLRTGGYAHSWDIPCILGVDTPTTALDVFQPCEEGDPCVVCASAEKESD